MEKYLKVIILFTCNNVNQLIESPVIVAADSSSNILGNINRSSIFTKKNLFLIISVFTFTNNVCNINTHRTVFCLKENALFKALHNFVFSLKVSFAFKIVFIKADSGTLVSFLYTVEGPAVHLFPESMNFWVTCFPLNQHIFRHLICFRMCSFWFVFFALEIFIKFNVALTYKVVALHAKAFRSIALCFVEELISKHRFTDVNTTVIDEVYLVNICTCSLENAAYRLTKSIVTHVSKMQRFICIWRRKFNHYTAACQRLFTVRAS